MKRTANLSHIKENTRVLTDGGKFLAEMNSMITDSDSKADNLAQTESQQPVLGVYEGMELYFDDTALI